MISQELIAKQRREGMRWNIINTLNKARPQPPARPSYWTS